MLKPEIIKIFCKITTLTITLIVVYTQLLITLNTNVFTVRLQDGIVSEL